MPWRWVNCTSSFLNSSHSDTNIHLISQCILISVISVQDSRVLHHSFQSNLCCYNWGIKFFYKGAVIEYSIEGGGRYFSSYHIFSYPIKNLLKFFTPQQKFASEFHTPTRQAHLKVTSKSICTWGGEGGRNVDLIKRKSSWIWVITPKDKSKKIQFWVQEWTREKQL